MTDSLMTAREVARLLGVPTSWVYEQSRRGRIPTVTLGRYRRYRLEAIEQWIQVLEARDQQAPVAGRRFVRSTGRRPQIAEYSRGGRT
jgi:excisionase family DNA binding protein